MAEHISSTSGIPDVTDVPRHVAIIMDGNGRWATERHLPRVAGHTKGVEAVRRVVDACARRGVGYLTLFAFSSENWRRPVEEVSVLMRLFVSALEREVKLLAESGIRLKVVGDLSAFEPRLRDLIARGCERTASNDRMTLTIAANYGGRWDILQAVQSMLREEPALAADPGAITEAAIARHLALSYAPEPDLFIRTGGEARVSNFMLWQLAYTEMVFTDLYWPDFDSAALDAAIDSYRRRERRFGRTSAQVAPPA